MTEELPSDSSQKRRIALLVAVSVAVILLLAGGAWALFGRGETDAPKQTTIEPAEETSATTLPPVPGTETSTSATATGTAEPGGPTSPEPQAPAGSSKIVFRLGNRLYVANDDGTDPVAVADAAQCYALSPDGRTLAVVYGEGEGGVRGVVSLFDVATGLTHTGGRGATPIDMAWAPDSSWIAYTALRNDGIFELKGLDSTGRGDSLLVSPGARPAMSVEGKDIAYKQSDPPGPDDPLMLLAQGAKDSRSLKSSRGALSWAWGPGERLYYTRPSSSEGAWEIWVRPKGEAARKAGSIMLSTPAHALDDLMVSADGSEIVLSAIGDDDYSRLMVFNVADARFFAVTTRRDAYPAAWTPDGRILYFEGNGYQGESSALMSIRSDGTGRRMVVSGAQP